MEIFPFISWKMNWIKGYLIDYLAGRQVLFNFILKDKIHVNDKAKW